MQTVVNFRIEAYTLVRVYITPEN